jgi:hypothetical protein
VTSTRRPQHSPALGPFSLSSGPARDYRKMWFQLWPVLPQALPYRRFEMGFDVERADNTKFSDSDQIPKLMISTS